MVSTTNNGRYVISVGYALKLKTLVRDLADVELAIRLEHCEVKAGILKFIIFSFCL